MIRYIGLFILLIPCCVTDLRTRLISVWYVGGFIVLASVYQLFFFQRYAAAGSGRGSPWGGISAGEPFIQRSTRHG